MKQQIIGRGAEAIIYRMGNKVIKNRIKKGYRISELDTKLRRARTKSEAKIISKLKNIIHVPEILGELGSGRMIHMQFIEGKKLSETLDNLKNKEEICEKMGQNIARMHDSDIIHGDLTTSNMILKNNEVYFIDFGLGFNSKRIEDKAVDLHLLKQALEAKHFLYWKKLFDSILKGYKITNKALILEQLKKVEARGRYKKGF